MEDVFTSYPKAKEKWNNFTANTTWTDGIPKQSLSVKLSANTTESRRQFLINGIRTFL
jgi:phage terminase large subunit-like protein